MLLDNNENILITGIILQKILTGIKNQKVFNEIKDSLLEFYFINPSVKDHVYAAELNNKCRKKGLSFGDIDFLIASIAINNNLQLVSADNDFIHIAKYSNLKIFDKKTLI